MTVGQSIGSIGVVGWSHLALLLSFVVLTVVVVGGLLSWGLESLQSARRARSDPPLVDVVCDEFGIPSTEQTRRLIRRYLSRTVRFRQAWTLVGIGASIAISVVWRPPPGQSWGFVAYPPTANVILMALSFWFVGLIRSELYNLRPRLSGVRTASLEVREVRRYLPPRMVILPRLSAVFALLLVPAALLIPHQNPYTPAIAVLGVIAVITLLVTEACERGIAHRSRPVLGPDLKVADEAIRSMASWSVAYGSAGLIAMLASFEAVLIAQPYPYAGSGFDGNPYLPRGLCVLLAFVLFCWAVSLAWRARRMVRPEPGTGDRARARAAARAATVSNK
jgi:hypothetical protein